MKKILFFFSVLTVFLFLQGCFAGYHQVYVAYDYDERSWIEDHWVYRFKEQDHFIYRRWYKDRWEDERRANSYWEKINWEKKDRSDRDDGRKYENEKGSEEKRGSKSEKKNGKYTGHGNN